jgi:hypothetical protein
MVLLTLVKPPRFAFDRLLKGVRGVSDEQKLYPLIFLALHTLYVFKRGFSHLRFMDFTHMPGRIPWLLWKVGIISFWQRRMTRKFKRKIPVATEPMSAAKTFVMPTPSSPEARSAGLLSLPVIAR